MEQQVINRVTAQTYNGYQFNGNGSAIALGGQDVGSSFFTLFFLTGINSSASQAIFNDCLLSSVTTTTAAIINCSLSGTLTLSSAASYALTHCQDSSSSTPAIIDFGAAVGSTHAEILDYNGRLEIQNLGQLGTDTIMLSGNVHELVLNANCVGGTITLAGIIKVTDNSGGAVTVVRDAQVIVGDSGALLTDVGGMSTGMQAEVNAEVLDVLTTDTFAEPSGDPGATVSLEDKISYLYTLFRNKSTQTATTFTLRNDADSGDIVTSAISDDATTFTKGKKT